jgi:hypothetical protein
MIRKLQPEVPAILINDVLQMRHRRRIAINLVKGVVDAGGELPVVESLRSVKREIGNDICLGKIACEGPSLADILEIHASEKLLAKDRNADVSLPKYMGGVANGITGEVHCMLDADAEASGYP